MLPDKITDGDKYDPAMKVKTQEEADIYFDRLVEHAMRVCGTTREEAEKLERINLGYWAGYYDCETMDRVERLFRLR